MKNLKMIIVLSAAAVLLAGCSSKTVKPLSVEIQSAPSFEIEAIHPDYGFQLKNGQELMLIGASEDWIYYLVNDYTEVKFHPTANILYRYSINEHVMEPVFKFPDDLKLMVTSLKEYHNAVYISGTYRNISDKYAVCKIENNTFSLVAQGSPDAKGAPSLNIMNDRLVFLDEAVQVNDENQKEYSYRLFEVSGDGIISADLDFNQADGQRIMTDSMTVNGGRYAAASYDSMQKSQIYVFENGKNIKTYSFDDPVGYTAILDRYLLVSYSNQLTLIDMKNGARYEKEYFSFQMYSPCLINDNLAFANLQGEFSENYYDSGINHAPYLLKAQKGKITAMKFEDTDLPQYAKYAIRINDQKFILFNYRGNIDEYKINAVLITLKN